MEWMMRQITINGVKLPIIKETNDIIICQKHQEFPIYRSHDKKEIADIAWQDIQQKFVLHTFDRASFNVPMLAAIITTISELNDKYAKDYYSSDAPVVDITEPVKYEPKTGVVEDDDEVPF
jgi:hypothetical protein